MNENTKNDAEKPQTRDPRLMGDKRSKHYSQLSSALSRVQQSQQPATHSKQTTEVNRQPTVAGDKDAALPGLLQAPLQVPPSKDVGLASISSLGLQHTRQPDDRSTVQDKMVPTDPLGTLQCLLPGLAMHIPPKGHPGVQVTPQQFTISHKHPLPVQTPPGQKRTSEISFAAAQSLNSVPSPLSTLQHLLPGLAKVNVPQDAVSPLDTLHNLIPALKHQKDVQCAQVQNASPANLISTTTQQQDRPVSSEHVPATGTPVPQTGPVNETEVTVQSENSDAQQTDIMECDPVEDVVKDSRAHTLTFKPRKQHRNVLTRMESYVAGPLSILQRAVEEHRRVRVWTRSYKHVRGICTGYVLIFDKHWNIVLADVDELYMDPQKKLREYTSIQHLISCQIDTEQHVEKSVLKDYAQEPKKRRRKRVKHPSHELENITPRMTDNAAMTEEPLKEDQQTLRRDDVDVSQDVSVSQEGDAIKGKQHAMSEVGDGAVEQVVEATSDHVVPFPAQPDDTLSSDSLSSAASEACDSQAICDKTVPLVEIAVVEKEPVETLAGSDIPETVASASLAAPIPKRRLSDAIMKLREQLWDEDEESEHELVIDTGDVQKGSRAKPAEKLCESTSKSEVVAQLPPDGSDKPTETMSLDRASGRAVTTQDKLETVITVTTGSESGCIISHSVDSLPTVTSEPALVRDATSLSTQGNVLRSILKNPRCDLTSFRIPKKSKDAAASSSKVLFGILKKPNVGHIKTPSEISSSLSAPTAAMQVSPCKPASLEKMSSKTHNPSHSTSRPNDQTENDEPTSKMPVSDVSLSPAPDGKKTGKEKRKLKTSHSSKKDDKVERHTPESGARREHRDITDRSKSSKSSKGVNEKSDKADLKTQVTVTEDANKADKSCKSKSSKEERRKHKHQKEARGIVATTDAVKLTEKHKKEKHKKDKSQSQGEKSDTKAVSSAAGSKDEVARCREPHRDISGIEVSHKKKHGKSQRSAHRSPKKICPNSPRKSCTKSPRKHKHRSPRKARHEHKSKENVEKKGHANLSSVLDTLLSEAIEKSAATDNKGEDVSSGKCQKDHSASSTRNKDSDLVSSKSQKRKRKKADLENADDMATTSQVGDIHGPHSVDDPSLKHEASPLDTPEKPAKRAKTAILEADMAGRSHAQLKAHSDQCSNVDPGQQPVSSDQSLSNVKDLKSERTPRKKQSQDSSTDQQISSVPPAAPADGESKPRRRTRSVSRESKESKSLRNSGDDVTSDSNKRGPTKIPSEKKISQSRRKSTEAKLEDKSRPDNADLVMSQAVPLPKLTSTSPAQTSTDNVQVSEAASGSPNASLTAEKSNAEAAAPNSSEIPPAHNNIPVESKVEKVSKVNLEQKRSEKSIIKTKSCAEQPEVLSRAGPSESKLDTRLDVKHKVKPGSAVSPQGISEFQLISQSVTTEASETEKKKPSCKVHDQLHSEGHQKAKRNKPSEGAAGVKLTEATDVLHREAHTGIASEHAMVQDLVDVIDGTGSSALTRETEPVSQVKADDPVQDKSTRHIGDVLSKRPACSESGGQSGERSQPEPTLVPSEPTMVPPQQVYPSVPKTPPSQKTPMQDISQVSSEENVTKQSKADSSTTLPAEEFDNVSLQEKTCESQTSTEHARGRSRVRFSIKGRLAPTSKSPTKTAVRFSLRGRLSKGSLTRLPTTDDEIVRRFPLVDELSSAPLSPASKASEPASAMLLPCGTLLPPTTSSHAHVPHTSAERISPVRSAAVGIPQVPSMKLVAQALSESRVSQLKQEKYGDVSGSMQVEKVEYKDGGVKASEDISQQQNAVDKSRQVRSMSPMEVPEKSAALAGKETVQDKLLGQHKDETQSPQELSKEVILGSKECQEAAAVLQTQEKEAREGSHCSKPSGNAGRGRREKEDKKSDNSSVKSKRKEHSSGKSGKDKPNGGKRKSPRSRKPLCLQDNAAERIVGQTAESEIKSDGKSRKKSKKSKQTTECKENQIGKASSSDVHQQQTDAFNIYGDVSDGEAMDISEVDGVDEIEIFRRGSDDEKPSTSGRLLALDVDDYCVISSSDADDDASDAHLSFDCTKINASGNDKEDGEVIILEDDSSKAVSACEVQCEDRVSEATDVNEMDQLDGTTDDRTADSAPKSGTKDPAASGSLREEGKSVSKETQVEGEVLRTADSSGAEKAAARKSDEDGRDGSTASDTTDDPLSKVALFGSDESSNDSGDEADAEDESDGESDGAGSEDSLSYATEGSESASGASQSDGDDEDDDESASVNEASVEDNASDTPDDGKDVSPAPEGTPDQMEVDGEADGREADVSPSQQVSKLVIGSRPGVISESDTDLSPKTEHPTVGYKSPKRISCDVIDDDHSDSDADEAFLPGEQASGPSISTVIEESQGFSVLDKPVGSVEPPAQVPTEEKAGSNGDSSGVSDSTEGSASGSGSESESESECNITDCDCKEGKDSGASSDGSGSVSDTSDSSSGESSGEVTCITISDTDSEEPIKPAETAPPGMEEVRVKEEKVSPVRKSGGDRSGVCSAPAKRLLFESEKQTTAEVATNQPSSPVATTVESTVSTRETVVEKSPVAKTVATDGNSKNDNIQISQAPSTSSHPNVPVNIASTDGDSVTQTSHAVDSQAQAPATLSAYSDLVKPLHDEAKSSVEVNSEQSVEKCHEGDQTIHESEKEMSCDTQATVKSSVEANSGEEKCQEGDQTICESEKEVSCDTQATVKSSVEANSGEEKCQEGNQTICESEKEVSCHTQASSRIGGQDSPKKDMVPSATPMFVEEMNDTASCTRDDRNSASQKPEVTANSAAQPDIPGSGSANTSSKMELNTCGDIISEDNNVTCGSAPDAVAEGIPSLSVNKQLENESDMTEKVSRIDTQQPEHKQATAVETDVANDNENTGTKMSQVEEGEIEDVEMKEVDDQSANLPADDEGEEITVENTELCFTNDEVDSASAEKPTDILEDDKTSELVDKSADKRRSLTAGDDVTHASSYHEDDILDVHGAEHDYDMFDDSNERCEESDEGLVSEDAADAGELVASTEDVEVAVEGEDTQPSSEDEDSTDGEIVDEEEDIETMVAKLAQMKQELAELTYRAKSREPEPVKQKKKYPDRQSSKDEGPRSRSERKTDESSRSKPDQRDRRDRRRREISPHRSDRYEHVSSRSRHRPRDISPEHSQRSSNREGQRSRGEQRPISPSERSHRRDDRRRHEMPGSESKEKSSRHGTLSEKETRSSRSSKHEDLPEKDSRQRSDRHKELPERERHERRREADHRDYREREGYWHSRDESYRSRKTEHRSLDRHHPDGKNSPSVQRSAKEHGSKEREGRRTDSGQAAGASDRTRQKDAPREREGSVCRMELFSLRRKDKNEKKAPSKNQVQTEKKSLGATSCTEKNAKMAVDPCSDQTLVEEQSPIESAQVNDVEISEKVVLDRSSQSQKKKKEDAGFGISRVKTAFCRTDVRQNAVSTQEIPSPEDVGADGLNSGDNEKHSSNSVEQSEGDRAVDAANDGDKCEEQLMPVGRNEDVACVMADQEASGDGIGSAVHQGKVYSLETIDEVGGSGDGSSRIGRKNEAEIAAEGVAFDTLEDVQDTHHKSAEPRMDNLDSVSEFSDVEMEELYKFSESSSVGSGSERYFTGGWMSEEGEELKNRSLNDEIFVLNERGAGSQSEMEIDEWEKPSDIASEKETETSHQPGECDATLEHTDSTQQATSKKESFKGKEDQSSSSGQPSTALVEKQVTKDGDSSVMKETVDQITQERILDRSVYGEKPSGKQHPQTDSASKRRESHVEARHRRERKEDYYRRREYEKRRYKAHIEKEKEYERRVREHREDDRRSKKALEFYGYMQKVMEKEKKKIETRLERYKAEYERWRRKSGELVDPVKSHSPSRRDEHYSDAERSHQSSSGRKHRDHYSSHRDDYSSPRDRHKHHHSAGREREYLDRHRRRDPHQPSRSMSPLLSDHDAKKSSERKLVHSGSTSRTPTPTGLELSSKDSQKCPSSSSRTPTPTETEKRTKHLDKSVPASSGKSAKSQKSPPGEDGSRSSTATTPAPGAVRLDDAECHKQTSGSVDIQESVPDKTKTGSGTVKEYEEVEVPSVDTASSRSSPSKSPVRNHETVSGASGSPAHAKTRLHKQSKDLHRLESDVGDTSDSPKTRLQRSEREKRQTASINQDECVLRSMSHKSGHVSVSATESSEHSAKVGRPTERQSDSSGRDAPRTSTSGEVEQVSESVPSAEIGDSLSKSSGQPHGLRMRDGKSSSARSAQKQISHSGKLEQLESGPDLRHKLRGKRTTAAPDDDNCIPPLLDPENVKRRTTAKTDVRIGGNEDHDVYHMAALIKIQECRTYLREGVYSRHVKQMVIRGDNIVMVSFAD